VVARPGLRISPDFVDEIVQHAHDEIPNECCGIVAAKDGSAVKVYRAANAEASPVRYGLDPRDQYRIMKEIEDGGWSLGAIYHSHTGSPAYPSQTDVNLAFYPDSLYLIVSLLDPENPDLRAFRIAEGRIDEAKLEIS
jgi:[CysO sulfur-carrier protein]-S-L-cysteine hydrolase